MEETPTGFEPGYTLLPENSFADVAETDRTPLKLGKRVLGTFKVAKQEYSEQNQRGKITTGVLAFASTVTGALETIPGVYEAMMGYGGISILQAVGNVSSGGDLARTSAVTGAITGAAVGAEMLAGATFVANLIHRFPKACEYFDHHKLIPTSAKKRAKASNFTTVALGASATVAQQKLRDPSRTLKQDLWLGAEMSLKLMVLDAVIVTAVGATVQYIRMRGHETFADYFEMVVKNPALWVGAYSLKNYIQYRKEKRALTGENLQ